MLFWGPGQLPLLRCYPDSHLLRRRARCNPHAPPAEAAAAWPLAARASAVEAVLEPGDVVFFPSRWVCAFGWRGAEWDAAGACQATARACVRPKRLALTALRPTPLPRCSLIAGGPTTRRASPSASQSPAATARPASDAPGSGPAAAPLLPHPGSIRCSSFPASCVRFRPS